MTNKKMYVAICVGVVAALLSMPPMVVGTPGPIIPWPGGDTPPFEDPSDPFNDWNNGKQNIVSSEGDYVLRKIKMRGCDGEAYDMVEDMTVWTDLPYWNFNRQYMIENGMVALYKFEGFIPILVDAKEYGVGTDLWAWFNYDRDFGDDDDFGFDFYEVDLTFHEDDVYMIWLSVELSIFSTSGIEFKSAMGFSQPFQVGDGGDGMA